MKDASGTVGGSRPPQIAILGEFDPEFPPHPATNAAILHSSQQLRAEVRRVWLSTQDIHLDLLKRYAGIWVAPGSPYKDLEKALSAIQYVRENRLPCFGTCGGFQHIVKECARKLPQIF